MTDPDATIGGALTPREREVLAMVAAGLTNREIGEALFISESTAGVHVSHLMAKLGVGSRTEAAAWAYHAGLVEAAPGAMPMDGPPGDSAPSHALEPPSGWFGRLGARLRQHDGRVAAFSIGGVVVLAAITVGLAMAALNGKQPVAGDLPSASASPSLHGSASPSAEPSTSVTLEPTAAPSIEASPTRATPSPTPIPLPTGTWTATGELTEGRGEHTATLLRNGMVLVVGFLGLTGPQASAELYDPSSGTWTATGRMLEARALFTATLLPDGKVLVVSGQHLSLSLDALASAELFDPSTGTWTATGKVVTPRSSHTATLLLDGRVLVAAGSDSGGGLLASAELYDPRNGTWTSTGNMISPHMWYTATLLRNGMVLVAGGSRDLYYASASPELYDPGGGTWTGTGKLISPRMNPTATLLRNGMVLVAGGSSSIGGDALASAELYDPSTGAWTATGGMLEARSGHRATLLLDGRVLVAGPGLASAELFDPSTGTWTATSSMLESRASFTATRLLDGRVLVAGGLGRYGQPVASAELYHPGTGT